jgi:hypothetical protein
MADDQARFTGNPVANAQALVAKANLNGEFAGSVLDVKRLNISAEILKWVEGERGSTTLADIEVEYLCNGDSMFHVNKGVIAFKMDGARNVRMVNTSVDGLENLGVAGSSLCGDYLGGVSHPAATLHGYGGAVTRGYTFAGTDNAVVVNAAARNLRSSSGSVFGFDILNDSSNVRLVRTSVSAVDAGWEGPAPESSPTKKAKAYGYYVGAEAGAVSIIRACATDLTGLYGAVAIDDASGHAKVRGGDCMSDLPATDKINEEARRHADKLLAALGCGARPA